MHAINHQLVILLLSLLFSVQSKAQFPEGLQVINHNLVDNGDFNKGNRGFSTAYLYSNESVISEGTYGLAANPRAIHHRFSTCSDHTGNGNMMVINGSPVDNEVVWSQKIKVHPNTHYVFSCWIASAMSNSPANLQFAINGTNHKDPINASTTTCKWKQFSTLWESKNNEYITISIVNKNTERSGNDFLLDDITFYECIPPHKTSSQVEYLANSSGKLHRAEDFVCGEVLILDKIKFHDNSTKFKGMIAANQTLFLIFQHMKAYPNTTLTLYGHTDVFGPAERNMELSKQRVIKIQRWLSMYGIKAHRINYEWFGAARPLVEGGGISNRRVEIKMSCEQTN
jgi:outer membrane protein OmpA-like peptidoglycan-associated protein